MGDAESELMLIFPLKYRRQLHRRAYKAQQSGHREVCGVFSLHNNKIKLHFLKNLTSKPYKWEICESELKGKAGTFHSHPIGDTALSDGDLRDTKTNELMLIYDVCGREAKLWKITGKKPSLV